MIASRSSSWIKAPAQALADIFSDRAVRVSLAVFAVLRIVTLIAGMIMIQDVPPERPPLLWWDPVRRVGNPSGAVYEMSIPPGAPLAQVTAPWRRYDTVWYIRVAVEGYPADHGIVFPPLYPILIRAVVPFVAGNYVLASLLVSNLFCIIAFILLYKLVIRLFNDHGLATRTLIVLAAFPSGFYLVAGYTEPLFLAFTLGAFTAALDRRWWLAGMLGFLASLTRLQGIVLCLPLAWIAYLQLRPMSIRGFIERIPAVIGAALGTASYYLYVSLNNLGEFERAYNIGWKLTTRMPWESVITYFERWGQGIVPEHEHNNAFFLLVMLLLGLIVLWKFRKEYGLYVYATLFVIMLRYHYGQNLEGAQFESVIRYVLLLFPCFVAAAILLRRRWMIALYVVIMGQWQLYLLDNFIHWRWVA